MPAADHGRVLLPRVLRLPVLDFYGPSVGTRDIMKGRRRERVFS